MKIIIFTSPIAFVGLLVVSSFIGTGLFHICKIASNYLFIK